VISDRYQDISLISRKSKLFRINRGLAADFEKTCTLLGVKETEAVQQAILDWVKKNVNQSSLETFIRADSRPIVFQNVSLIKMQVTIVKTELEQALEAFQRAPEENKILFMKEIKKILPTAFSLAEETRDPELEALIRKVEETL